MWTLGEGAAGTNRPTLRNGLLAGFGAGSELYYDGSKIYTLNSGQWYRYSGGATGTWTGVAKPF